MRHNETTTQPKKKKRRVLKGVLIAVSALLVLVIAAGLFAGNFFFNLALNPHSDKSSIMQADHNEMNGDDALENVGDPTDYEAVNQWFSSSGYTMRTQQSDDGLTLSAYEIKNETPSDKWVVLCHGYMSDATHMAVFAQIFYEQGYNALMPDARGHGNSEGDYIGMGWPERLDIVQWVNGLVAQYPSCEIVLYGISMGGATVMMTSGEQLPKNVKAIVEDCGYTSAYDEFAYQLDAIFGLPAVPIMQFASFVAWVRAGYRLPAASAVKQVAKSETPILFIHGGDDTFVPSYMIDEVYDAAICEKQKLVIPGACHGMSAAVDPELYWSTVWDFLGQYVSN